MRSQLLTAVALLMALGLAGCSGGGDGDTNAGATGNPAGAGATSAPDAPGATDGKANHPPTASLEMVMPPTGNSVNFTVNGSDPDRDELTWTLAFGDNSPNFQGSKLPSKVNHTFQPGSYTVNLTITDGKASTYAIAAVTLAHRIVQSVDGHYVIETEGCAAAAFDQAGVDPGGAAGATTNNVTRVQFAVNPASIGLPYNATWTFDTGYLYVSVDFFGSGGTRLSGDNTGQSPAFGGTTIHGKVPDGAATAVLFACGGPAVATVHYEV